MAFYLFILFVCEVFLGVTIVLAGSEQGNLCTTSNFRKFLAVVECRLGIKSSQRSC